MSREAYGPIVLHVSGVSLTVYFALYKFFKCKAVYCLVDEACAHQAVYARCLPLNCLLSVYPSATNRGRCGEGSRLKSVLGIKQAKLMSKQN